MNNLTKMTQITPELAQSWIDQYTENAAALNIMRPIRVHWVSYLADQMARGLFMPTATVVFGHLDGKVYIINGNHTLRAIVKSNATQCLPEDHRVCKSEQELRNYYALYDKGLSRTRTDSFRAYDAPHLIDLTQSGTESLASAVNFMMMQFGLADTKANKVSDRDLLEAMQPWVKPFKELTILTSTTHGNLWYQRIVRRRPVCSVALVSLKYQPVKAREFWKSIVDGTNFGDGSPALKLRDYLLIVTSANGGNQRGIQEAPSRISRTVAHCWNKFLKDEAIYSMRINMTGPIEILGQPKGKKPSVKQVELLTL